MPISVTTGSVRMEHTVQSWRDLFYANRVLVGVALALTAIAVIISVP